MQYFESKKLREERGEVVAQMQELTRSVSKENREMTPEEIESFDKMEAHETELKRKIDSAERVERATDLTVEPISRIEPFKGENKITRRDHENAFKAWSVSAAGHDQYMRSEWQESAEKLGVNLNSSSFTFKLKRAQTLTDDEGGYSAQDGMIQGVEKSLLSFGNLRQVARVIRTSDGNTLPWLTVNDTATTADSHTENTADVSNTDITLGKSTLGAYTYTSGVFPVSLELLQDSSIDFSGLIGELLGERIARTENTLHTTGAGTTVPQGVTIGASAGVGCGYTAPDYYTLSLYLKHAIDSGYRTSPNFRFMFNDDCLRDMKLVVDGNDRPLWKAGMAVGSPDLIDGTPYTINNDMPDPALDARFMLCGDFSKFLIRDVGEVTITALRERYAEQLCVAYIAHHRTDSLVLNSAAIKYAWGATGSYCEVADLS